MRIVLTGAAGRVGRALSTHWAGHDLVPLDRADCDLTVYGDWNSAFAGADVVVHLASDPNPDAEFQGGAWENVSALLNVLRAAHEHGVRRFVYASSVWADAERFGLSSARSYYAASKQAGEALVTAFGDSKADVVSVCLRLALFDPSMGSAGSAERTRLSTESLCQSFDEALALSGRPNFLRYALGR